MKRWCLVVYRPQDRMVHEAEGPFNMAVGRGPCVLFCKNNSIQWTYIEVVTSGFITS